MKKIAVLTTASLLILSGCGVNLLDLDGAQRDKLWNVSNLRVGGVNVDNLKAV